MVENSSLSLMVSPPCLAQRYSLKIALRQYFRLILVLLTEYRTTWFYHVFFGTVLPLGLIFFFKMVEGNIEKSQAIFLLGGDLTTSIAYGPTTMLITRLGWGRQNREFTYWAALPIPKSILILAMVSIYLLFAIPGLVVSYLLGCLMLGLPLTQGVLLIILVPLGALSLTGFGAFLGVYASSGEVANAYGNALMGFVTFLSPMLIPLDAMPLPLQFVARFVPTTYVADAFRMVLAGSLGVNVFYDIILLFCFTAAFLLVVHRKLDWRAA